ncbi:MAG TPA: tRNA epoxyqueuosine(34) reductase QueG [Burkholderiales bacterium]|nr:tRNA epoxyqueuosine(34) reductase QueG [Burkholderiales bacterium]
MNGMQGSQAQAPDLEVLARNIRQWGVELGFQHIGIADCDLGPAESRLAEWLARGWHGDMDYMAAHGTRRSRPSELVPGTIRVISARMNYFPDAAAPAADVLADPALAYVSRYAVGRDYHKVMRRRLQRLADRITAAVGAFRYRAFTDSAPVMEVALAQKSGLGWRGKHTLLLNRDAGSYFFIGELYTDLPLPVDAAVDDHCGTCRRCIDACPTGAIVAPYELDARRCISYLTIEHKDAIPEALRPLIGNRVYGCDDCQLVCPWNRFAVQTAEPDFTVRNGLDSSSLVTLFGWSEAEFHARLAGSAIHRIGYERWLRNIAVGLGNALRVLATGAARDAVLSALERRRDDPSALVREHVTWALSQAEPANVGDGPDS